MIGVDFERMIYAQPNEHSAQGPQVRDRIHELHTQTTIQPPEKCRVREDAKNVIKATAIAASDKVSMLNCRKET